MSETNPFIQGKECSEQSSTASANLEPMIDDQLPFEYVLEDNYQFRRNVLSGMVEYKKTTDADSQYARLTSEALNTIFIRTKRELSDESNLKSDIKAYVESDIPPLYNPVESWLDSLPAWDGKDRVMDFLKRIPGITDEQMSLMRIWLRSVVANWLAMNLEHGNETVPLLIGSQGCGKSTFCVRFLPECLRQYYLDHFNLGNKFDKEMALTGCLLICLDEMDQYKAGQMAQLKQALSKVNVNGRRIYGRTIDVRRRYASFIATTNNRHPLVDKTGSRRYLTIEIPNGEYINNMDDVEYEQLYAQILHEVRDEKMRYWYTNEETLRIQELNAPYEQSLDLEQMIVSFFRKPKGNEKTTSFTSMDIRKVLRTEYPDVSESHFSSPKIGKVLKEMKVKKHRSERGMVYGLIRLAA
ncbi:MAG: VapE family protein [Prevotellaceae bacterium]|nr:VapE family protein [Prevotellaceae bacterium]